MRRTAQSFLYVTALLAAGAGAYYAAQHVADELETRTGDAVKSALRDAEIDWVWVDIDGLLVTLRGPAPDEASRFRALSAASEVLNPLNLRDEMSVTTPVPRPNTDYRVEILRNGDSVLAHGLAPRDGGPDLAELAETSPDIEIVDLIARLSDPVPDEWTFANGLAVEAIDQLRTVRVILTPDTLELEGIAPDRETARAIEDKLAAATAHGIETEIALKLPRPVLSPFLTRFTVDTAGARFDTCAAESLAGRSVILDAGLKAGAPALSDCETALGAPDSGWSATVAKGIQLVAAAGAGSVTFSDLTVTVILPPDALADTVIAARLERFESDLPEIYSLRVLKSADDPTATAGQSELRFAGTRSPEGLVNIRGPVGPLDARNIVQTFAEAQFGAQDLHTALRGGTDLPDGWAMHVMAAIDPLAQLETGSVSLTPDMVAVRGETGDPELEEGIQRDLAETVAPGVGYTVDVTYREALDPIVQAQKPSPEDCVTGINAVLEENDVSFPPGSVAIDTEGFDTIGAIADIMAECGDIPMEIGGHTDSQGGEEMNQLLSQARADAVLNALLERDVLVGNLSSHGYGETEPIADNATAEGREANRRIRFSLIDGPAGLDDNVSGAEETAEDTNDG